MKIPRFSVAAGSFFLVLAALPLLVGMAPAASAADGAAPPPGQLILDRVKPAVARIEMTVTADLTASGLDVNNAAIVNFVRARLSALSASGQRFSSVAAATQAVVPDLLADLTAHPSTYLQMSSVRSDSQSETMLLVGSGVLIDQAGYVLTASGVVPDRAAAVTALGRGALASEEEMLKADTSGDLGLWTADQRVKLGRIFADFLLPTIQADRFEQKVSVSFGPVKPGESGGPSASASAAAEVVRTQAVGPAGVTVLKIGASTHPSVGLRNGPDLPAGSAVTVVGYPSPTFDGGGLDPSAAIQPTAIEGTVASAASSLLPTTAVFSPGAVGAPVLAADGTVAGLAVKADSGLAVIPVSQLRQAIGSTAAHAATSPAMVTYQAATRDLSKQWYKRAQGKLQSVTRSDPTFPYAADALATTRQAVLDGKDRSPKDRPVVAGSIAGALLLVVIVAAAVIGAGSGGRGKPAPGWQPAGW